MKVPEYIRDKMHKIAELSAAASSLSLEVDSYFIDKGYKIENLRNGDGISLEELEFGHDVTDDFCDWFENGGYNEFE